MNKTTVILLTLATLIASPVAMSKEKSIQIKEDSSGLAAEQSENIARTALAMGVKEPITIRKNSQGVAVSGSSATACNVKLSADNPPKIQGVSCK